VVREEILVLGESRNSNFSVSGYNTQTAHAHLMSAHLHLTAIQKL
jgi:hypothetical protein